MVQNFYQLVEESDTRSKSLRLPRRQSLAWWASWREAALCTLDLVHCSVPEGMACKDSGASTPA